MAVSLLQYISVLEKTVQARVSLLKTNRIEMDKFRIFGPCIFGHFACSAKLFLSCISSFGLNLLGGNSVDDPWAFQLVWLIGPVPTAFWKSKDCSNEKENVMGFLQFSPEPYTTFRNISTTAVYYYVYTCARDWRILIDIMYIIYVWLRYVITLAPADVFFASTKLRPFIVQVSNICIFSPEKVKNVRISYLKLLKQWL